MLNQFNITMCLPTVGYTNGNKSSNLENLQKKKTKEKTKKS